MATKFRKQGLNCSMMVWKRKQKIDGRWRFHLSAERVQGQRRKAYTLLHSFSLALSASLSLSEINANLLHLLKIGLIQYRVNSHDRISGHTQRLSWMLMRGRNGFLHPHPTLLQREMVQVGWGRRGWASWWWWRSGRGTHGLKTKWLWNLHRHACT